MGVTFVSAGIITGLIGALILTYSSKVNYDVLNKTFMVISVIGLVVLAIVIQLDNQLAVVLTLSGVLGI